MGSSTHLFRSFGAVLVLTSKQHTRRYPRRGHAEQCRRAGEGAATFYELGTFCDFLLKWGCGSHPMKMTAAFLRPSRRKDRVRLHLRREAFWCGNLGLRGSRFPCYKLLSRCDGAGRGTAVECVNSDYVVRNGPPYHLRARKRENVRDTWERTLT